MQSYLTPWAMVALFGAHFLAFALLGWRKKTKQYLPALITFALLILVFLMAATDTDFFVAGHSGRVALRIVAGISAVFSIGTLVFRKVKQWRTENAPE